MSDGTHIQWCDSPDGTPGATWNIITGCDFADDSCHGCYAALLAATRLKNIPSRQGLAEIRNGIPVWTGQMRFNEEWLDQPLRWRRGRRVFVCAHGDLFHEDVPDAWIDQVFAVMALCQQHTFLVLTKRAARMRKYVTSLGTSAAPDRLVPIAMDVAHRFGGSYRGSGGVCERPLPNVELGVSFGRQDKANERLAELRYTPAARLWCSYEPALEAVDIVAAWTGECRHEDAYQEHDTGAWICRACDDESELGLDFVVVGGESGRRARPFDVAWADSTIRQCRAHGVPVFVKQLGRVPMMREAAWHQLSAAGAAPLLRAANKDRVPDGFVPLAFNDESHAGDINEWPQHLRVREYPRC